MHKRGDAAPHPAPRPPPLPPPSCLSQHSHLRSLSLLVTVHEVMRACTVRSFSAKHAPTLPSRPSLSSPLSPPPPLFLHMMLCSALVEISSMPFCPAWLVFAVFEVHLLSLSVSWCCAVLHRVSCSAWLPVDVYKQAVCKQSTWLYQGPLSKIVRDKSCLAHS